MLAERIDKNDYRNPFRRWEDHSWIRSKPVRRGPLEGLPFPEDLVPLAMHPEIASDPVRKHRALAYRLLAHLQFTTVLELCHVNPACCALVRGEAPVPLSMAQRNDALRIYCDEGGHALFVELLSEQVEATYQIRRETVGRPRFDVVLASLLEEHRGEIPERLIRLFFVAVSETLVTKILRDIPDDPTVAPVVRGVIGDHAADEAQHSAFFRWYFPQLWSSLGAREREAVGRLLPRLVWTFLGPDRGYEANVLVALGVDEGRARRVLEETYAPAEVARGVRKAAQPTLTMFQNAGVLESAAVREAFAEAELLVGDGEGRGQAT